MNPVARAIFDDPGQERGSSGQWTSLTGLKSLHGSSRRRRCIGRVVVLPRRTPPGSPSDDAAGDLEVPILQIAHEVPDKAATPDAERDVQW